MKLFGQGVVQSGSYIKIVKKFLTKFINSSRNVAASAFTDKFWYDIFRVEIFRVEIFLIRNI